MEPILAKLLASLLLYIYAKLTTCQPLWVNNQPFPRYRTLSCGSEEMVFQLVKRLRINRVMDYIQCCLSSVKESSVAREPDMSNETCPICLEIVGSPDLNGRIESWTTLYCGHFFGSACIQTWLQRSFDEDERQDMDPGCPICRSPAKQSVCRYLVYTGPSFERSRYAWEQYHMTTIPEARSYGIYLGSFQRHAGARRRLP